MSSATQAPTMSARLVPHLASGPPPEVVVHISSFAIIRSSSGQLLLTKKQKPDYAAGSWTIPGAIIGYGEHPEDAVKRIVKEQLGADVTGGNPKLLQIQSYGDKHWDLCFVYDVHIDKVGNLAQTVERAEYFDLSKFPPELSAGSKDVLDKLNIH